MFRQMRIKELRSILEEYNAPCRGCIEKTHYMDRIAEVGAVSLSLSVYECIYLYTCVVCIVYV